MLVFDATPLIYLTKVGKLHLIGNISEKKVIPGSVFEEVVVKGKEAGKTDADKGCYSYEKSDVAHRETWGHKRRNNGRFKQLQIYKKKAK